MFDGYLSLLLHAHLPYVNHPEHDKFLEEDWLFEALAEVYLPIFDMIDRLWKDLGIKSNLTISISPPLINMLENNILLSKFEKYVNDRLLFLDEELKRYGDEEENFNLKKIVKFYKQFYKENLDIFIIKMSRKPLKFLANLQELNLVEIITTSATHTFLPNFIPYPKYINLQERLGLNEYNRVFKRKSKGFWLPECGFYPGVESELKKNGVKYSLLEFHGVLLGNPMPVYGAYAPVYNREDFLFFARDLDSAKQVWSREIGYPANKNYRDFYKDVGYEWDTYYSSVLLHKDHEGNYLKGLTGLKYWQIAEDVKGNKKLYDFENAKKMAKQHAEDFWKKKIKKAQKLRLKMNKPPVFVAPYDMELFGHWWFEGVWFLENLIKLSHKEENFKLITFSDYIEKYPKHQVVEPVYSSWGENGFSMVWNNEKNNDIIIDSTKKVEKFIENLEDYLKIAKSDSLFNRVLLQLVRELVLLTSSDWPFLINSDIETYSRNRFNEHLNNYNVLEKMLLSKTVDEEKLELFEKKNCILQNIEIDCLENL